MKVKLFQIAPEKDSNNNMFMNYEWTMNHGGVRTGDYELVFDGEVEAKRLEDIFQIFNLRLPEGYRGRSMSVSDVVWAEGLGTFFVIPSASSSSRNSRAINVPGGNSISNPQN